MSLGEAILNLPVSVRQRGSVSTAAPSLVTPVGSQHRRRSRAAVVIAVAVAAVVFAAPAAAQLTVTPLTWDVVGLDHNRPATSGPKWFPVGARVCNGAETVAHEVTVAMQWGSGSDDTYIVNRPGSLTELDFPSIAGGECVDAYFEIELVNRARDSFGNARPYTIEASADGFATAATPAGRQIYIQQLVSQNRNTTHEIRYCDPTAGGTCDPGVGGTGWVVLGAGASINLAVGNRYFVELTSQTATAYEELQSFITLSNTIFQILAVSTTYSDRTAPLDRVPVPNHQLWGDGCLWASDPASANYNSCLSTGKVGGVVKTLYEILIISGGGESVTLEALHYDRSGGSFHYNTDYSQSPGDANFFDPTDAGFSKRFIPSAIAAGGIATLRFTITNPNPVTVAGYNFTDLLPAGMEVAEPVNPASTCGGAIITGTDGGAGRDFIDFSGGTIGPNGSCAVRVDVTVPYESGAPYPLELLNVSGNLFVGEGDTGINASATLTVNAEPEPPLVCVDLPEDGAVIARWDSFSSGTASNPTTPLPGEIDRGVGTAPGNTTALTYSTAQARWTANGMNDAGLADKLANARANNWYFEFQVDTKYFFGEVLSLTITWSRHQNSVNTMTLDYGPAPASGQPWNPTLGAATLINNGNNATTTHTVSNLDNLNPNGMTLFRLYLYNTVRNDNQDVRIHNMVFRGIGAHCEPLEEGDPPVPPTIAKVFDPNQVRIGQASTLTFTLTNPNTADDLTGVTFRDELPPGMTVVSGTFVNNCSTGSTWGPDGDPGVLLFADGTLAANASCTVAVDVVSTTIGDNLNLSDPIDSRETLPGNSAEATLVVLPPPITPSIFKVFDPNPLLDPTGSSTLTFRITNNDPDLAIASVAFTDLLPEVDGVQMVPVDEDPLGYTTNTRCGASHSFTWNVTTFMLAFNGGEIAAGEICEIYVDVKVPGVDVSDGPVEFPNETSRVSHVFNGTTYMGNAAKATLLVDEPIPGISIFKEVGLTNDPEGEWFTYLVTAPGPGKIYYKITVENTGEVVLNPMTVSDPDVSLSGCSWTSPLPVAAAENDNHIARCIVGPVDALEGTYPNTATATGSHGGAEYIAESTATYRGQQPTAVVMGRVELLALPVGEFLHGIGAFEMEREGLLNLLQAWDPPAAGGLAGEGIAKLLAALAAYLDPDGDGLVVVFHWETLEERGTVGFFAERMVGGGWVRINSGMLPGLIASPMGAEYWLADPGARPGDGYQYRLIEVEAWGTTREYGPFDLRAGGGNE